ncbi:MAG: ABC transporter ATP-binding protein [Desulfuromonadales bacterium]|nr:MAG: ABC transporter ATP-binding protein [Desulfuromonadales bacterium]
MSDRSLQQNEPLLRVIDLLVEFPAVRGQKVHAVSGVNFSLARGETLGLVGESGCGKSSLARAIMQLPRPTSGRVILDGEDLTTVDPVRLRILRSRFQMIFQDPVASFNPFRSVGESIGAPLRTLWGVDEDERTRRVREMMEAVGLDSDQYYRRRPFQLSGGQCQRAGIARALMTEPRLLVCDEPVSSLDVSVQAQIINLLREVKGRYGLSMLFISHDLGVVRNISDRVAVMYLGRLCEVAPCAALYAAPVHPYTNALLAAIPRPDPERPLPEGGFLPGELPSAIEPPSGCRFRTRCPRAQASCSEVQPELREIAPGHLVACHYPLLFGS